jgi:hypothetical protein
MTQRTLSLLPFLFSALPALWNAKPIPLGSSRKENIFFLCELCALSEAGGEKIPHWDFESLPPAAALLYNLILLSYVKILYGSWNRLSKAFAQLDSFIAY